MKSLILTVLEIRTTKSKKPIEDYISYLYPLRNILKVDEFGRVTHNNNAFWKSENRNNRADLICDIYNIRKRSIRDSSYYHILNRFENGDRYGIEVL